MKLEYREVHGPYKALESTLNEYGELGWDLASLSVNREAGHFYAVIKREVKVAPVLPLTKVVTTADGKTITNKKVDKK